MNRSFQLLCWSPVHEVLPLEKDSPQKEVPSKWCRSSHCHRCSHDKRTENKTVGVDLEYRGIGILSVCCKQAVSRTTLTINSYGNVIISHRTHLPSTDKREHHSASASRSLVILLPRCDLISQAQRNALRLTPYPQIAAYLAASLPLHADVEQRVLSEQRFGVQVGGEEVGVSLQCLLGGEALHVGDVHDVGQVVVEVGDLGGDSNLVLPSDTQTTTEQTNM